MNKVMGKIGKSWSVKESFSWKKLLKMFTIFNPVEWAKDISSLFNLRKLIIYALIVGSIFSYGWYKGTKGKPIEIGIGYGKEAIIELEKNRQLYIAKDGKVYLRDGDGEVIKQISVKDVPTLRRKLAPLGLKLEPVLIFGIGSGFQVDSQEYEVGGGVSFLRIWKLNLETFLTNKGVYLGSSYSITDSSGLGIGVGQGWKRDWRGILYYRIKF